MGRAGDLSQGEIVVLWTVSRVGVGSDETELVEEGLGDVIRIGGQRVRIADEFFTLGGDAAIDVVVRASRSLRTERCGGGDGGKEKSEDEKLETN